MSELHKKILNRLLAAWVAVSLALGGGVVLYGLLNIDRQLVAWATEESLRMASANLPGLDAQDAPLPGLTGRAGDFARQQCIVAELFDRAGNPLLNQMNPRHTGLAREFFRTHARLPPGPSLRYERQQLGETRLLQVMLPLTDSGGRAIGHFHGLFVVDDATLRQLRTDIALTLAVVLGAVLLTSIVLYPVILALNRDVVRSSQDLLQANVELMEVMGSAIAKRDSDTNIHNYRVTVYAVRLAEALDLPAATIRDLIAGAFLHDVGKIGIPDAILLKPGRLDAAEFAIMRTHVALGVDILRKSAWLSRARDVVENHHEKFDGSGYPRGLRGDDIPVSARVFAVVDVFDALTSRRPYKAPLSFAEAMAIIHADSGRHFDPRLVEVFTALIAPLHDEISRADDAGVEAMLYTSIQRYYLPDSARRT